MQPSYLGVYAGLVTNVSDPTANHRIRAQVPQISGTSEINWAAPMNPGDPIPAVGSIVWMVFNGGDLTKPVYTANSVTPFPAIPEVSTVLSWTTPTLAAGYTNNGNGNGTVMYRVVDILGSRQVEWQGGLNLTYPSGSLANSGNPFTANIQFLARPTNAATRSCTAPCSLTSSTVASIKLDVTSGGLCALIGTNSSTIQPPWVSLNGVNYFI